jgi:8-hydroxy-5-deazaflavin:NADPH oxidoreductase
MKIGVIGTGFVGQMLSEKLSKTGNDVMIGTRDIDSLMSRDDKDYLGRPPFREWSKSHPDIKVGLFKDAASLGEVIVNAANGAGTMDALNSAGKENLSGKVILDVSNPLDFSKGMPPSFLISNTDSLGELIQRTFPDAKVVKSLNTMNGYIMVNPSFIPGDHNVFTSGNDEEAKTVVKDILKSFGWKEENMIDLGDITTSRGTEQMVALWVRVMGALNTPMFNFNIVMAKQ